MCAVRAWLTQIPLTLLAFWRFGVLAFWRFGVLAFWRFGVLAFKI
jgi:hypothetical protein